MLKENWRFISRMERLGDAAIIVISFFISYYGRASLMMWNRTLGWNFHFEGENLAPISAYFIVLLLALVTYGVTLNALGAYSSMRLSSHWRLLKLSAISSAVVFLVLSAALFLLKLDFSRSFITLFCLLVGLFLTAERYVVLRLLRFWRRQGKNFRNVMMCGVGEQSRKLASEIAAQPELGLFVRAFVDLGARDVERQQAFKSDLRRHGFSSAVRVIDGSTNMQRAIQDYAIDEVIFADIVGVMPEVEEMVVICSEMGLRTTIAADLFSIGLVKSGLSYFGDTPLIHFHTPPGDRWELNVKRMIDVFGAVILLVLFSPILLVIALLVRKSSPGSIIFRQMRVGLNGRLFELYKFRSMYEHSPEDASKLRSQNEMKGPAFKLKYDPRVTPVGKWLRRFSADELLQLWNVLRGDMSLVGPRPPIPGEVSMYERRDRRRLSMRPGLTCTWQVSGRNEIADFESWVNLDLDYIDHWSLKRDIVLLLKTIPAVLFGTGAR